MIKVVAISLLCAFIIIYLKNINSELTLIATVASGILILSFSIPYITNIIQFINKIANMTAIDSELFKIIFKITAIGYLIEFSAGTLNDFGLNSLSSKIVLIGKLIIFSTSIPIIYAIIELFSKLIQ